jgi:hypothetical protein
MTVVWFDDKELQTPKHSADQYGVPLITIAAAGAYLASRAYTQQTSITETVPLVPGSSTMQGSLSSTTQKSGNNSYLPYGLALAGSSLSSFANVTIGGTNQTRVLKRAAAGVASTLQAHLRAMCQGANAAQIDESYGQVTDICVLFKQTKEW